MEQKPIVFADPYDAYPVCPKSISSEVESAELWLELRTIDLASALKSEDATDEELAECAQDRLLAKDELETIVRNDAEQFAQNRRVGSATIRFLAA